MTETPTADVQDAVLDALLARIAPAKDAKKNLKVMVYSDPGGRKSSFCGSAKHNLILDVEGGLTSLHNKEANLDLSTVDVLPFKSFYQAEMLVEKMASRAPALDKYKVLSIDSMSELHKKGLAEVRDREYSLNPNSRNRYTAETEDHTENNEHIRLLVSQLRDLDRDLIITAHARSVQQKDKSLKIYPDFSEKLANTLAGMMDVVAYAEQTEDGVTWWCISDGYVACKNRIGLPARIDNPTWDTIYSYFEKHTASTTD